MIGGARSGEVTVAYADTLSAIADRLRHQADRCGTAAQLARMAGGPDLDETMTFHVDAGIAGADEAARALGAVADRVTAASELLSTAERAIASGIEALAGQVAALAGLVVSRLALAGAIVGAGAVLPIAVNVARLPREQRERLLTAAGATIAGFVGRPAEQLTADGAGWLVTLSDEALAGAAGLPPMLAPVLGDLGLGAIGTDATARSLVGVALVAGISGVAPARVERAERGDSVRPLPSVPAGPTSAPPIPAAERRAEPPDGVEDRVARLPDGAGAQIRIERYSEAGADHFEVFIAGTDPNAEWGGANPWDMASNLALVAEQLSTSRQAVAQALDAAGATSGSSVVFTGHSQGALIATVLAESGEWNTTGLVTVGGPLGSAPVTGDYPAIVIAHDDDLVVGAGGRTRDTEALVIRASAYPEGAPELLAAHAADRYRETAAAVDADTQLAVADERRRLPTPTGPGETLMFRAERVRPS